MDEMVLRTPISTAEKVNYEILVIGYYNGKAIVKSESGNLFYMECEEQIAPEGTVLENDALTPISELSVQEQREIHNIYD